MATLCSRMRKSLMLLRPIGPPPKAMKKRRWPVRSRRFFIAFGGGLAGASALAFMSSQTRLGTLHDEGLNTSNDESLLKLLRAYAVYTACAIPPLVDCSPKILSAVQSIPIMRQISRLIVEYTFFEQFVGGRTARDTFPILEKLRNQGTGTLLAYSVEVREQEGETIDGRMPAHKIHIEEIVRSIDAAAEFEAHNVTIGVPPSKTWAAVKLTALLPDAGSLERYSHYISGTRTHNLPGNVPFPYSPQSKDFLVLASGTVPAPLTQEDLESIKDTYKELRTLCARARDKGVTLVFDAEHSWYTPAIDAIVLELTREFNRPTSPSSTPLVYGTYQSYLRRGVSHLQACISDAKREGYMLGVKLVRGAYQTLELSVYEQRGAKGTWFGGSEPPVWTIKSETDETYNKSVRLLVSSLKNDRLKGDIPVMGVMFSTHNVESMELVIKLLSDDGLATPSSGKDAAESVAATKLHLDDIFACRVTLAQLYGMRDDLTTSLANRLTASLPVTMKYVPYGSLEDVIPYLARRAIENKTVLGGGGAAEERRIVGAKLKRKLLGLLFSDCK